MSERQFAKDDKKRLLLFGIFQRGGYFCSENSLFFTKQYKMSWEIELLTAFF